jgi:toxin YoeB
MKLVFSDQAWEDYLFWQKMDKRILNKVNILIQDIRRNKYEGIGKAEPLRHEYSGYWSRRINTEHRLIYKVTEDSILIAQIRYHY